MENELVSDGEQDAKSKAEKDEENKKELALRTEQLNLVRAAIEKLDKAADRSTSAKLPRNHSEFFHRSVLRGSGGFTATRYRPKSETHHTFAARLPVKSAPQ